MQTIISLQQALHPGIVRIIIAAILFIPFIYLITLKSETEEEEEIIQNDIPSRGELYQAMYSQLAKKEERPVIQMKQSDLAV
jgi:hypothetical protein